MSFNLFHTPQHRLRLIWTALVFLAGGAGGMALLWFLPVWDVLGRELTAAWLLIYSMILVRTLERRPVATLGLLWTIFSGRQALGGWMLGSVVVTAAIVATVASGNAHLSLPHSTLRASVSMLSVQAVTFLFAAMLEELLCRGYLYQIALERMPVSVATIAGSAIFAALHFLNPHVSALAFINTFLAGLWFSAAYLRTRQLWLPITLHAGWNFTLATIWGAQVSGTAAPHLLATAMTGPDWLTGGEYGLEGGLIGTVVVMIALVITARTSLFQISPDQFALRHRVRFAEDDALLVERDS